MLMSYMYLCVPTLCFDTYMCSQM